MNYQITSRRGILKDPRLRGNYADWLRKQSSAPRNVPGQDANRAQQAVSAVQGKQYHTATNRPLYTVGQRLQQAYRNRPNEQAGLPTPATPAQPANHLPMRRA